MPGLSNFWGTARVVSVLNIEKEIRMNWQVLVISSLLAFTGWLGPAGSSPASAPSIDCPNVCSADLYWSPGGAGQLLSLISSIEDDGAGTEYCDSCYQCAGSAIFVYYGQGSWLIRGSEYGVSGTGPNPGPPTIDLDAGCDHATGALHFYDENRTHGTLTLYCGCAP